MRTPTESQYEKLLMLGNGCAGVAMNGRVVKSLVNHGWVTHDGISDRGFYNWVRISPEGLRALALAVERYGLYEIKPHMDAKEAETPPIVRKLRAARDEAREERDAANIRAFRAESRLRSIAYEVGKWDAS